MADESSWRVFDRIADDYDEVLPFFREVGERFVAALELAAGTRFLDLGAGGGALTGPALRAECAVTAIDAAPAMVARLRRTFPAATALVMDAQRLELADASFDVVGSAFVLHVLDDPAAAVAEAFRVLVPGGRLAVSAGAGVRSPSARAVQGAMDALFAEFAAHLPPHGGMGAPVPLRELLLSTGFTSLAARHIEVELSVPDGETLWRWALSHGYRAFIDDLPDEVQHEFRRRLVALPDDVGGTAILQRAVDVLVGTKPNRHPPT